MGLLVTHGDGAAPDLIYVVVLSVVGVLLIARVGVWVAQAVARKWPQ